MTKFDPRLTPGDTRNSNFDLTIRTGQDQHYCEDYQIPFPTTIHGSKWKLKQLRYLENRAKRTSMLPKAITFDPTIGFSIYLVF